MTTRAGMVLPFSGVFLAVCEQTPAHSAVSESTVQFPGRRSAHFSSLLVAPASLQRPYITLQGATRGPDWGSLAPVSGPHFSLPMNGGSPPWTILPGSPPAVRVNGGPGGQPPCPGGGGVLAGVFPEPSAASWDSVEFLFFSLCLQGRSVGLST